MIDTNANNKFLLGDLRGTEILDQLGQKINIHQVPLFLEPDNHNTHHDTGGSGTLATFGDLKGILTATHVIAPYRDKSKEKAIYIPCIPTQRKDAFRKIKVPFINIITIDDLWAFNISLRSWDERRLDIAFVQLDENTFIQLVNMAYKKPYDLKDSYHKYQSNKQLYLSNNDHTWSGIIYGHPREGAETINEVRFLKYSGPCIGGAEFSHVTKTLKVPIKEYKGLIPDLLFMERGTSLDDLPASFSGASGAGSWFFALNQKWESEIFLAGVFVCADLNNDNQDKKLYSRGPKSLYEIFCDYLNQNPKNKN